MINCPNCGKTLRTDKLHRVRGNSLSSRERVCLNCNATIVHTGKGSKWLLLCLPFPVVMLLVLFGVSLGNSTIAMFISLVPFIIGLFGSILSAEYKVVKSGN